MDRKRVFPYLVLALACGISCVTAPSAYAGSPAQLTIQPSPIAHPGQELHFTASVMYPPMPPTPVVALVQMVGISWRTEEHALANTVYGNSVQVAFQRTFTLPPNAATDSKWCFFVARQRLAEPKIDAISEEACVTVKPSGPSTLTLDLAIVRPKLDAWRTVTPVAMPAQTCAECMNLYNQIRGLDQQSIPQVQEGDALLQRLSAGLSSKKDEEDAVSRLRDISGGLDERMRRRQALVAQLKSVQAADLKNAPANALQRRSLNPQPEPPAPSVRKLR